MAIHTSGVNCRPRVITIGDLHKYSGRGVFRKVSAPHDKKNMTEQN